MAADYLHPYQDWARRHGTGFGVTLWASQKSQQIRFEVFQQMFPMAGKRVLDAGCSRGDLAAYLHERAITYAAYVGIDAVEDVVAYARTRGLPRTRFLCGDIVEQPQLLAEGRPHVICISGTLNTMADPLVYRVLDSAWEAAEEALLFNFLSSQCHRSAPPQDTVARRLDTMELLEWAFSRTWSVVFRQDYFQAGHDATILMHKR